MTTSALLVVLLVSALRTVLFAGLVAGTLAGFRVRRPALRLSVWTIVLGAALAMPVLGRVMPAWRVPVSALPSSWLSPAAPADGQPFLNLDVQAPTSAALPFDVPPKDTASTTTDSTLATLQASDAPASLNLSRIAFGLYLVGMFVLAFRALWGWTASRRLERAARPVDDVNALAMLGRIASAAGLRHSPYLLQSSHLVVPMTMSVMHPAVVLPDTWRAWDEEMLQAVLAHEVSHVARLDTLTLRVSLLNRAIYWFNPLAWWLPRLLSELAEQASDEAVLRAGTSQTQYARTLLEFFRAVPQTGRRADWHVAMARGDMNSAETRIERILMWKGDQAMKLKKPVILAALLLMTAGASAVAALQPSAIAHETPAPQPPPQLSSAAPIQSDFGVGAYQPGNGVSWPEDVRSPKPAYTDGAKNARIEGVVLVEAVILADGTVGATRVVKSLDTRYGLDDEAVRTAQQWIFKPAQLNGRPVPVVVLIELHFKLPSPTEPPSAAALSQNSQAALTPATSQGPQLPPPCKSPYVLVSNITDKAVAVPGEFDADLAAGTLKMDVGDFLTGKAVPESKDLRLDWKVSAGLWDATSASAVLDLLRKNPHGILLWSGSTHATCHQDVGNRFPAVAGQARTTPVAPAGKWTVLLTNMPDQSLPMELAVDSTSVKGTFNGVAVVGEFANGRLTFASLEVWKAIQQQELGATDQIGQNALVHYAMVSDNGTLVGHSENYLRGYGPIPIKRWSWKATR